MDVWCTIDIKWDGEEKEKGVETCHEESGEALAEISPRTGP